jgi:hypothetical protein
LVTLCRPVDRLKAARFERLASQIRLIAEAAPALFDETIETRVVRPDLTALLLKRRRSRKKVETA